MPGVIQRIARSAFQIDRHAVEPVFVIRSAIGVVVTMLAGFLTGQPILAVAGAIGAMSTGFGSLQGVYRTRAATMLGMALAMAVATALGELVGHSVVLSILALALWGFAYGLFAALGPGMAAIMVNGAIALIVFEYIPLTWTLGAQSALMMLAGGVVQTVLLALLWPIQRYPQERHALAVAYRDLAAFAGTSAERASVPSSASLRTVRATLADPRPFGRRAAAAAFQTLLDEAERIRTTLALLATSASPEYAASRETIVAALREIAAALDDAHAPEDDALYERLRAPAEGTALRALFGQLRAAWRAARVPLRGVMIPQIVPSFGRLPGLDEPLQILRANLRLDAPFFRHAVRLAVVLGACGIVGAIFSAQHGYWVTLTAALVLRPDFTTTFARGFARIGGTIVGVITATAIVLAVPDTPHVYLALAIFFAAIGYAAFQLNYALFSLTVTAYVVFLLALLGVPEHDAVVNRLFATIAGGLLAMLSYALWPTWEGTQTLPRLRALVDADLDQLRTLLAGLAGEAPRDPAALQRQRAGVWAVRAAAEESLERMLGEPSSTHEIAAERAIGIMAATQRLGLANTALAALYLDPGMTPVPELRALLRQLDAPLESLTGLRDAAQDADRSLAQERSAQAGALRSALDLAIDSVNTLAELWNAAGTQPAPRESPARA